MKYSGTMKIFYFSFSKVSSQAIATVCWTNSAFLLSVSTKLLYNYFDCKPLSVKNFSNLSHSESLVRKYFCIIYFNIVFYRASWWAPLRSLNVGCALYIIHVVNMWDGKW